MIELISRTNAYRKAKLLDSMFRLRHQVFVERMGWKIETAKDGREWDQFDHEDAVYLVIAGDDGEAVASARFLPTTSPYLLGDVFPNLVAGEAPRRADVWEVSRLAIDHRKERLAAVSGTENVSGALFCGIMETSMALGLSSIVSVSDIRLEKILDRAGWIRNRLGPAAQCDGWDLAGETFEIGARAWARLREKNGIKRRVIGDVSMLPVIHSQPIAA